MCTCFETVQCNINMKICSLQTFEHWIEFNIIQNAYQFERSFGVKPPTLNNGQTTINSKLDDIKYIYQKKKKKKEINERQKEFQLFRIFFLFLFRISLSFLQLSWIKKKYAWMILLKSTINDVWLDRMENVWVLCLRVEICVFVCVCMRDMQFTEAINLYEEQKEREKEEEEIRRAPSSIFAMLENIHKIKEQYFVSIFQQHRIIFVEPHFNPGWSQRW